MDSINYSAVCIDYLPVDYCIDYFDLIIDSIAALQQCLDEMEIMVKASVLLVHIPLSVQLSK